MGPVHFTDGFDRPDTIALGLDAPRLVTVVAGALSAYAVMQAPLPFAVRVCCAVVIALLSAVLGWARYAGRPVLHWAWLGLRFVLSPQSGGVVERVAQVAEAPQVAEGCEPVAAPASAPAPLPPPVDDGEPVWAQWLHFETDEGEAAATEEGHDPADPEEFSPAPDPEVVAPSTSPVPPGASFATPAHVVETPREAPLVVVMDHPAGELSDHTDDEPAADPIVHLPFARPVVAPPTSPTLDDASPVPYFVGAPRRITFFSLNGGSGRTTLATEVACTLAARGRHLAHDGTVRPLDVALLDLDLRSATVSVRLGIPQPTLADYITRGAEPAQLDHCMVRHGSGVRALLGMPKPVASGATALEPARVAEIVHRLERDGAQFVVIDVAADDGAQFVVIDVAADLGAVTTWVLSAVHDIFVVITPTASGVQDAYRTTAALRRLGVGHKLRYVVNRARGGVDLDEVMGDLGGRIAAVIPYDAAVEDAENDHRIAALGEGPAAAALHDLAALLYPSLSAAPRRSRLAWRPWRRRAG